MGVNSFDEKLLLSLLEETSFHNYHCLHSDFFANHTAHGIIALYRLGASESQVRKFIEIYTENLKPPQVFTPSERSVEDLLGKCSEFSRVRNFYADLLTENDSWKSVFQLVFKNLYKGLLGGLLHPLIHIGYGILADSRSVVIDGLAFMHFSYLPKLEHDEDSKFGDGNSSIFEVLKELHEDKEFLLKVRKAALGVEPVQRNFTHTQVFKVLFNQESDTLTRCVNKIKFDASIDLSSLPSMRQSIDHLLNFTIHLYLAAELDNNFFLLHGITTCYALKQILLHLDDYEVAKDIVRQFVTSLVCVYISIKCPRVKENLELNLPKEFAWTEMIEKLLSSLDRDEHVFKVVQICKEVSDSSTCIEIKAKCWMAAKMVLENDFTYGDLMDINHS